MMSGGSVVILSLLKFLDVPTKIAIGTLKLTIAGLTLVSMLTYFKGGAVDVRIAPALTFSSLVGAVLGSAFFLSLPEKEANLLVAIFLTVGVYFTLKSKPKFKRNSQKLSRKAVPIIGFLIGFYIGILGVASTLIVIAALGLFFRLDMLKANGTAKMIIFVNNSIAALTYASKGSIDYHTALLILAPLLLGSWLGAKTALKMGDKKLKVVFAAIALLTALKLITELF
ncbi:hypothetical protein PAP_05395 [Palaeococcus pacificus DY20341]|uniref:Probable membrane transporter protein n=2 Tax=Palaeococcus TaxID=83867 RepID=A0A075LU43_9EURY|nr:hypothetical protein PAP_05395 [Palaeococcus pacificus DY20341]